MRKTSLLVIVLLVVVMMLAPAALARPPFDGCPVGPTSRGTADISPWELWNQEELEAAISGVVGDPDFAEAQAEAVFASGDRNGDGLLCVMKQVLPNDASGFDTWFVTHDNTARPKSNS